MNLHLPPRLASRILVFIACLLPLLGLSSCGRKRPIVRGPHASRPPLLTATKTDLLRQVAAFYDAIHSLKIVADLTVSRGSVYKGEIVDHSDFKGFIDFRKPGDIRVVTLLPLVRTIAFEMVSDGGRFRAYLKNQNRFIEGEDDAPATSPNPIENMRPKTFLSALLVKPVDSAVDFTVLQDDTNEQYSHYILQDMRKLPNNDFELLRTVTFDRVDLRISSSGNTLRTARLSALRSMTGGRITPAFTSHRRSESCDISKNMGRRSTSRNWRSTKQFRTAALSSKDPRAAHCKSSVAIQVSATRSPTCLSCFYPAVARRQAKPV